MSDGVNFCSQLCSKTSGVVDFNSEIPAADLLCTPSDPLPSPSLPSSTSTGQKRGSRARAPSAKKKKAGYQEKISILEEEIPEHQIGEYINTFTVCYGI